MDPRRLVTRVLPHSVIDRLLLTLPALYRTRFVAYETYLIEDHGVPDLLAQLERCLYLPGDIVECGCARCGASAIMALELRNRGIDKRIFACDSFQGFDQRELERERLAGRTRAPHDSFTSSTLDYVSAKLRVLGLDDIVRPVPGFFRDTLETLDASPCFVLVDCDLEDSVALCLDVLFPRLVPGGRILVDDYRSPDWLGARVAVDRFLDRAGLDLDHHGPVGSFYLLKKRS